MRAYFDSRYAADNLFVAAAGRVDFDALVEQVAKRCSQWQPQASERHGPRASSTPKFEVVLRPTATQQYVLQLADAPASEDDDRYAAKLLATIVGDDSGSRFYWELVDPCLVETARPAHYEYLGAGMFYMMTDKNGSDRTVKALTKRIALSVLLIVLIIIGMQSGYIQPHGM